MSYNLKITSTFERELKKLSKKYPLLKKDIAKLGQLLKTNPYLGESLGKNCYKIRIPITGKNVGKSGGARVTTYIVFIEKIIYFLAIYDKAEKATISDAILKEKIKNIK